MKKSQEVVATKSQTLINQAAPHQSFLARFQRWEWILVGLIIAVVVFNTRISPTLKTGQERLVRSGLVNQCL